MACRRRPRPAVAAPVLVGPSQVLVPATGVRRLAQTPVRAPVREAPALAAQRRALPTRVGAEAPEVT
ncbi:hypothetical protein KPB2_5576 [Klebsiella pneumoniae Kb677]|nr:hypothetical protein KPB2_5576 [Klebsiella pneumoniae Kb677]